MALEKVSEEKGTIILIFFSVKNPGCVTKKGGKKERQKFVFLYSDMEQDFF